MRPGTLTLLTGWLLLTACHVGGGDNLQADPPRLLADTSRVDFPQGELGQPVEVPISLSNPGGGVVHFHASWDPAASSFLVVTPDGQARRGAPGVLTLRYLGQAPGAQQATLVVDHDGAVDSAGARQLRISVLAITRGPPDCDDRNPCTLDQVDANTPGGCAHLAMAGPCDDGNACTTQDRCVDGACAGAALHCDDGIACTVDHCDPAAGCVADAVAARCDDQDPCTADSCDVTTRGCTHAVMPTGSPCGAAACDVVHLCVAGQCVATGTPEGYPCDDGDPCTSGDVCRTGACVPGHGGGTSLGTPQVVQDILREDGPDGPPPPPTDTPAIPARFATQVGGYWPVAIDGVQVQAAETTPDTLVPTPQNVTLLWRGSTDSSSDGCYRNPAQCTEVGNPCAPAVRAPIRTDLLLSQVSVVSGVLDVRALEVGPAYVAAAMEKASSLGMHGGVTQVPDHSLENVSVTDVGDRLLGAALFRFVEGCPGCQDQGGAPQNLDAGYISPPARICLPEGRVLVIFQVQAGSFSVVDSRWLDVGLTDVAPLRGGLPMLATAASATGFGVAYGSTDCSALVGCDSSGRGFTAHLLRYARTEAGNLTDATVVERPLTVAWPGVANNVDDFTLVADGWCLGWTERSSSLPPVNTCTDTDELRDAWHACLDGPDATATLYLPLVKAVLPVDQHRAYRWNRQGQAGGNLQCSMTDTVSFLENASAITVMTRGLDALPGLARASLANVLGAPVFMATDTLGNVNVARVGAAPSTAGFSAGDDARLSPLHAPRAGGRTSGLMLSAMGEVGLSRNSLPQPAMVLIPWTCGAPGVPVP